MARNQDGGTALHYLCDHINYDSKAADKIRLLLEIGDASALLSTKNIIERTPLQIATYKDASNEIKNLLAPQFKSLKHNNNLFSTVVPVDSDINTPIKRSSHNQQTTLQSSSTNQDPNETIRKLQAQLKAAQEHMKLVLRDHDQKCVDCSLNISLNNIRISITSCPPSDALIERKKMPKLKLARSLLYGPLSNARRRCGLPSCRKCGVKSCCSACHGMELHCSQDHRMQLRGGDVFNGIVQVPVCV